MITSSPTCQTFPSWWPPTRLTPTTETLLLQVSADLELPAVPLLPMDARDSDP